MPSWTPGSYLMREFPRHVQDFAAATGRGPAARAGARRTRTPGGSTRPRRERRDGARTAVYANELTRPHEPPRRDPRLRERRLRLHVRRAAARASRSRWTVDAPGGWRVATALRAAGPEHRFAAAGYDELVDSPLEIGTHEVLEWEQEGMPHRYAVWGRGELRPRSGWSPTRGGSSTRQPGSSAGCPTSRYLFILHLAPGGARRAGARATPARCRSTAGRSGARGTRASWRSWRTSSSTSGT